MKIMGLGKEGEQELGPFPTKVAERSEKIPLAVQGKNAVFLVDHARVGNLAEEENKEILAERIKI